MDRSPRLLNRQFLSPLICSPHIGEQVRSSPRHGLFKRELAFGDICQNGEYGCSTDEDFDMDSDSSNKECKLLKKEMAQRNSEKRDLMHKIKSMRERYKTARLQIQKEEVNKKQQLRVLIKTQESHLQEKNQTIRNLELIVQEQEQRILFLESVATDKLKTNLESVGPCGFTLLTQQISILQAEKVELHTKVLTLQHELDQGKQENEECIVALKAQMDKENMNPMNNEKSHQNWCDLEKQLIKLELENEELRGELEESKKLQPSFLKNLKIDPLHIKKIEEENESLKDRILDMEADLLTQSRQAGETQLKLKVENKALEDRIQSLSKQLRDLELQFFTFRANEPQIVTKIKTVEVESEESIRALESTMVQNSLLRNRLEVLQSLYDQNNYQLSETQKQNANLQHQVKSYQIKVDSLRQEMLENVREMEKNRADAVAVAQKVSSLTTPKVSGIVNDMQRSLAAIKTDFTQLRKGCQGLNRCIDGTMMQITHQIAERISNNGDKNKELVQKYRRELALRKQYYNELVELKGNIRVFCRVRPIIQEDGIDARDVTGFDSDDESLVYLAHKGRKQMFEVDRVFKPKETQKQVFEEVKALITSVIDGFNVCIFAYGQTGSGKTFTMEGPAINPGINQRALAALFLEIEDKKREWQHSVSVSVIEIYNENVRDLLSSDPLAKLEVKMNPEGSLHVPGLTNIEVSDLDQVNQIFLLGNANRATACTNMNQHSSRSHALLCVNVVGVCKTTGSKTLGKLNLVDLAGSERVSKSGADGDRLKEAQSINKSLSSLGDVMHALRSRQPHIPYRNSKLTYLLQDSLGGDSKTIMVVHVSPADTNANETVCTLNFAQRVRTIQLGQATRNLEVEKTTEDMGCINSPTVHRTPTKGTPRLTRRR